MEAHNVMNEPQKTMNELQKTLIGNGVAAAPERILEALDEATTHRCLAGAPHTIYEEVWHLAFWQEISLKWIEGDAVPFPGHAAEGFPPADGGEPWETLCHRFLAGTERAAELAGDAQKMAARVVCPTRPGIDPRTCPALEQMESLAAHNTYHLGRIVLLRQIFGCWPPPAGGDTW
ncbi:DinB family protein [Paracidobacterium acidisoli]|uniref:DinB family protein n=1 Tax=Paracidobacterium acidisoli TaxID=2303751 RepID=UPI001314D394|nr:DinB family protein [Paracidobacterium acidisoli]MBT9332906.1 DinB family protein [Paracidobacterium acidisoli]